MSNPYPESLSIAQRYLGGRSRVIRSLGWGTDGIVYQTANTTAIKIHHRKELYHTELEVYKRLDQKNITHIGEHVIPRLIDYSNEHLLIEMTVVEPPYILDFAKATIDHAITFSDDAWEQWIADRREVFGDNWPAVAGIYNYFKRHLGVYLHDLTPRNINFDRPRDEPRSAP